MELIHLVVLGLVGFGFILIFGLIIYSGRPFRMSKKLNNIEKINSLGDNDKSSEIIETFWKFFESGALDDFYPNQKVFPLQNTFFYRMEELAKKCMRTPLRDSDRRRVIAMLVFCLNNLDRFDKSDYTRKERRAVYEKALQKIEALSTPTKKTKSSATKKTKSEKKVKTTNSPAKNIVDINRDKNLEVLNMPTVSNSNRKNKSVNSLEQIPKENKKSNIENDLISMQYCVVLVAIGDGELSEEEVVKISEMKSFTRYIMKNRKAIEEYEKNYDLESALKFAKKISAIVHNGADIFSDSKIIDDVKRDYFEAIQIDKIDDLIKEYAGRISDSFIQKVTSFVCVLVAKADDEFEEEEQEIYIKLLEQWRISPIYISYWIFRTLVPVLDGEEPDEEEIGRFLISNYGVSSQEELYEKIDDGSINVTIEKKEDNPVWSLIEEQKLDDLVNIEKTKEQVNETRDLGGIKGLTPIMVIADSGTVEQLESLIKAGADVLAKTEGPGEIYSVLMFAAKSNDVNKVKMLLDAGSDVNAIKPGEALYSALGIAAAQGNRELVQMLLQAGADIHWRDMHGIDILKRAAMEAEDSVAASMIEFLASAGLSCQSSDDEGFFAIHNAAQEGKAEVIRTLIKYGADPNQKVLAGDDEGTVPLKYAVQSGSYEVYSTLIELGADVSTFRQEQKEFDDILFIGDEGGGTTLDLLDSLFFNDLQRTNGHYVEKDMFQIANDLVENRGFRPSMNSLAQSLLYDHGEELRSILFRASKKEFIEYGINKNPINFLAILGAIIHIYDIDLKTNVFNNFSNVLTMELGLEREVIENYRDQIEASCGTSFNAVVRDLGIPGGGIDIFSHIYENIESVIDKCGLKEWWNEEFSEKEREIIADNTGTLRISSTSIPGMLSNIVKKSDFGYNSIKENRNIIQKFYEKSDQLFENSEDIIDRHFFYNDSIRFYYFDRENKESMKKAIEACRKQIDIAPSAAEIFKKLHGPMPEHTGYKQLAIILDKQNKYDEAIKICKQAESEGWSGDWIPRITRYEKAKAKIKK